MFSQTITIMKKKLKLDHTQKSLGDALGVNDSTHAVKILDCVKSFADSESTKISHLAEMMDASLDYNSILLLAVENVMDKISDADQYSKADNILKRLISLLD